MKACVSDSGRIVISIQGHDKGRWYCVVSVDSQGLLLCCDGKYRSLDHPKRKQVKHLVSLPMQIDLQGKGGSGGAFTNGDLRKALLAYQKQYEAKTEWPKQFSSPAVRREQKEECALVQK